jgi:hypothetical protein
LSAIACSTAFASPALADVSEVSGSAFATSVNVDSIVDVTSPRTPLVEFTASQGQTPPADLGPFQQSVLSITAGSLLSTGVLNASTEGGNLEGDDHSGYATSSASVNDLSALGNRVTASTVSSECTSNGDGSTGSSSIENLRVGGVAVTVGTAPNTVIPVPTIGSVTINEQIRPTNGAGDTSIIVRAVHVRLNGILGTGDIIIAESRCGAKGPDVVPVAPIGLLGVTALLGLGFAGMQWKNRRDGRSVAASTH